MEDTWVLFFPFSVLHRISAVSQYQFEQLKNLPRIKHGFSSLGVCPSRMNTPQEPMLHPLSQGTVAGQHLEHKWGEIW